MKFVQSVTTQGNILRSLLRFSSIRVLSVVAILALIVPASAANSTSSQAQEGDVEAARLGVANAGGVSNVVADYSFNPDLVGSQSGTIPLNGTLIPTPPR